MAAKWMSTLHVLYEALCDRIVEDRTVIVAHPLNFAARLVQDSRGVPNISIVLQPWLLRSNYRIPKSEPQIVFDFFPNCVKNMLYRYMDSAIDKHFLPGINKLAAEKGIEKEKQARRIFDEWFLSPDRVLLAFPHWYCPRQPDWPRESVVEATHFPLWKETSSALGLPEELINFLAKDSNKNPPIVITCGTANPFCSGADHFLALAQACSKLNYPSIILTSEPSYVPQSEGVSRQRSRPADCLHFTYLPLSSLLQHCACCIHHGGIGTSAECLRAGIPQVCFV